MLTTAQAAALGKRKPNAISRLCAAGRIPARKMGRDWLITASPAELCELLRTLPGPGRPKRQAQPA